jgi:hypothetical protein
MWCGIEARYPDASTAWRNTNDRHPGDKTDVPRGAAVYWTGGSSGFGHIALSLGNGMVRSTDAGGSGRIATVAIDWVQQHWGLPYAGWAWDINEVTILHRVPKPPEVDTNWERTRQALLVVLNSEDAKKVSEKRTNIQKFLSDTKKALEALPKE